MLCHLNPGNLAGKQVPPGVYLDQGQGEGREGIKPPGYPHEALVQVNQGLKFLQCG